MYAALLSNRYLTSRLIPFIAIAAVALCVALVVTVVSVMTGFLNMLKDSGRLIVGDVILSTGIGGMPYADEFVADLRGLSGVQGASPLIDTIGLLRMPYPVGNQKEIAHVQVWAVDPVSLATVTDYAEDLYWKPPADAAAKAAMAADDPRLQLDASILQDGARLIHSKTGTPGIALGMHVSVGNARQRDGSYLPRYGWFMPGHDVTLTVVPVSGSGKIAEPREQSFTVVNEVQTGIYEVDKNRVYIPLHEGQRLLRLDEAPLFDLSAEPDALGNYPIIGKTPARVTKILVRAKAGITARELRDRVEAEYFAFGKRMKSDPTRTAKMPEFVSVLTWEQQLRDLITPVEKEREMMRVLFSLIYLVCAGLILSIFWAIVIEKTRDIGILRSVGASRLGVLWIFLRYGLIIGVVGSALGVLLAWGVIRNINAIHEAIGSDAPPAIWIGTFVLAGLSALGLLRAIWVGKLLALLLWTLATGVLALVGTALALHHGTLIWDPSVYYFTIVPDQVDWTTAWSTALGGVLFSVIGAAIPAAKAADIDPVEALRYG
ncbi:MAG: ABC transporter permease [Phycisphaerales bacterium]|nr:ABC transporter permease [Phycisphaerales bacterium]